MNQVADSYANALRTALPLCRDCRTAKATRQHATRGYQVCAQCGEGSDIWAARIAALPPITPKASKRRRT